MGGRLKILEYIPIFRNIYLGVSRCGTPVLYFCSRKVNKKD